MSERTVSRSERELIEKAHKFLPGGSLGNIFSDVVMERGAGSKIWDISGNEYVDYLIDTTFFTSWQHIWSITGHEVNEFMKKVFLIF